MIDKQYFASAAKQTLRTLDNVRTKREKRKVPKITLYITNHNYGKYLEESIESALCQSCRDFELLIIDDNSTDNSRESI